MHLSFILWMKSWVLLNNEVGMTAISICLHEVISSQDSCRGRSGPTNNTIANKGNQSKRPHSKTATTRTDTLNGITTRTATLLWSKRPHCFGQNGHIGWEATKTVTLFLVKTATLFWSKRPQGGLYLNEQKWLPKWPHCIWSKRPQIVSDINFVKSEYLNAFAWHPKTFIIHLNSVMDIQNLFMDGYPLLYFGYP